MLVEDNRGWLCRRITRPSSYPLDDRADRFVLGLKFSLTALAITRYKMPRGGRSPLELSENIAGDGKNEDLFLFDAIRSNDKRRLRSEEHTSELQSRFDLV